MRILGDFLFKRHFTPISEAFIRWENYKLCAAEQKLRAPDPNYLANMVD